MKLHHYLAAASCIALLSGAAVAEAKPKAKRAPAKVHDTNRALLAQLKALQGEVAALKAQVGDQAAKQAASEAQLRAANEQAQQQAAAAETRVAAAETQIAAIPAAIQESAQKVLEADKPPVRPIKITPGGYAEFAGIYRQHFVGNDISSAFNAIPFPNSRVGHVSESRFSARGSRLSLLAEGAVSPAVKLSLYGEFDFQGAAQNANSNEANSYNPRIRNLYGTIDWDHGPIGLHLLAGQNWSLVTMNGKGITPRNEVVPATIDGDLLPGFAWTRQPQIRLAADFFDKKLWIAVSAENPATTFGGAVPPNVTSTAPAGSGFDSNNTLSLNHVPDLVGKVAYEGVVAGRSVHIEGFGLYRSFNVRLATGENLNVNGYGFGGGITLQVVPKLLDVQFSGMAGRGIGRYGASQLPDVTFSGDGRIHPLHETILLAGATLHATPTLDIYAYAGEERVQRRDYGSVAGVLYGYGNPLADNSGCLVEGGTCNGNSRIVRQLTAGLWQKIYQGSFGRAQVGFQYAYTDRTLFSAVGGAPRAKQNAAFVSFRYYPF